tara:strand:- start:69455 stop:70087 length:633 start_codon:yes stop_codon:yes gene_type:complete
MNRQMTNEEVDFLQRLKWTVIGVFCLLFIALGIYDYFLDKRISSFEDSLRPNLPHELEVGNGMTGSAQHQTVNPVQGQIVYVPAYSHVYHGKGKPHLLTITLSIRNTSVDDEIVLKSVKYHGTRGTLVRSYLDKAVRIPPIGTTEVIIEREDASGGSGANFLVEWFANQPVTAPIIEAVMIDTKPQQSISFARRGVVIKETVPRDTTTEK